MTRRSRRSTLRLVEEMRTQPRSRHLTWWSRITYLITLLAVVLGLVLSIAARIWVLVVLFALFVVGYLAMARIRMSRKTFDGSPPPG
jgi:type IV secretory pathway VirB6-like protein